MLVRGASRQAGGPHASPLVAAALISGRSAPSEADSLGQAEPEVGQQRRPRKQFGGLMKVRDPEGAGRKREPHDQGPPSVACRRPSLLWHLVVYPRWEWFSFHFGVASSVTGREKLPK